MKHSICIGLFAVGVLLIVLSSMAGAQGPGLQTQTGTVAALGTAFTYQGELRTASGPVSGTCHFQFGLWDALTNGAQVGSTQTVNGVSVSNGRFAVQLDFGSNAFSGDARWLQIAVQCSGDAGFTPLSPRQPLTPAPYALSLRPGATISGTGSHPTYAALALRNDAGYGLHVLSANWDGVRVDSTSDNGVYVGKADNGVHVNYADFNGLSVYSATHAGVHVAEAGTAGVWVSQAGQYGVGVYKAGNPSFLSMSTFPSGFEVEGAEGYGLYVGRADMDGVVVDSASSAGVRVNSANVGVHVNSASDVGVHVISANRSGVLVQSANRYGVYVASAGEDGVYAHSTSASFYGGRFYNSATGGAGLYARGGNNTAPDLVLGGNSSTSDDGRIRSDTTFTSSDIFLISNDAVQIELDSDDNESGNFWILNGDDNTVFSVNENGDMTAIGTKSAVVTTPDYGQRKLYTVESPENWFEDFGSAQLVNGQAAVLIEPIFAQTVNLTETYHVFLTPLGDCALYVSSKMPTSFSVKAIGGQTCSIAFDYRIVAKRLGYESLRLDSAATGGGTP